MRTIYRNNYTPQLGDYHDRLIIDGAQDKKWLFDCDGVYTEMGGAEVVNEKGDSTTKSISQKLFTDETNTLAQNITDEANTRSESDRAIWQEIEDIEAASDVTDIVGTHADLENYDTSKLKDNDIIKVLEDETQDGQITYYRWDTDTETFSLVGAIGPYYTKTEADNKFQDKLTAGTNITIDANNEISATDTTYSNFVGTDGVDAGAAGLVPAPATTDTGKFLSSDGTWETAAPTLYNTYGQNTDAAMTQKATTDLVYTAGDPKKINIGDNGVTGGTNSIIIGSEDSGTISSSATDIIAIGHNITDNNNESIAIGHGASTGTSSGNGNAIAIGHNATASNVNAIAIGSNNGNPGDSSATRATGISAIAIGRDAYASGQESLCIGRGSAGYTGLVLNTSNTYAEAYADGNYQGFAFAVGPVAYAKNKAMAIGHRSKAVGSTSTTDAIAIGFGADSEYSSSIALGAYAKPRAQGVVDVSTGTNSHGYQGANDQSRTDYRVISGVHDPDQAQDAATKNYVDTQVGNIETILQTLNSGTGV